jgi:hypothetical protein
MVLPGVRCLVCLDEVAMRVKVDISVLGQTNWRDYVIRFFFGGLITAVAGIIANRFGAAIGGLFLAFPAIFPASATLIEKHEKQKKEKQSLEGTERGIKAASIDAAGSAMGSIGLLAFAFVVSKCVTSYTPWVVLGGATLIWLTVSVVVWEVRKSV